MSSAAQAYLQIDIVGAHLYVYWMAMVQWIRPGSYDVRLGDVWVKLGASEGHVNTGGRPVRCVLLWGNGPDAERIILLEAKLRASGGPLQLKGDGGETLDLILRSVRSSLFVTGTFLAEGDEDKFPCRFTLPGGRTLPGFASEQAWHRKAAIEARAEHLRALGIGDMAVDDQLALIRAVADGSRVLVEKLPWP